MTVPKYVRNEKRITLFDRFGRAATAVGRIGFDYKRTLGQFKSVRSEDVPSTPEEEEEYAQALSQCHLRSANVLLKLCQANGGCFIKVGQHIGALDYLLPEEYVDTMKVLHNRAPKMPMRDVFKVIVFLRGKAIFLQIGHTFYGHSLKNS